MSISFHRGACGCCVRVAKWLPVLFITTVVGWSYYAYVYQLCFRTISEHDGWFITIFLLFPYHFFLGLFVWSYWNTVFTSPGSVPKKFALSVADMDNIESSIDPRATLEQIAVRKDLPVAMRSIQGEVRYCSECSHVKPDRAHHCSVCGHCVLKMDHHCPWVNNCVAFQNYKYFILFLGYAVLYCMFVALSTLKYFLLYWSSEQNGFQSSKFHILFLFFVAGMFCISVMSLFGYHLYLVSRNQTTLESFRAPIFRPNLVQDKRGFHLGTSSNIQEVFGDNKLLWFFPIPTYLGDGIVFPQRSTYCQNDEEMGCAEATSRTPQLLKNGRLSGQLRQKYRNHDNQGSINRSQEELVPMINATQFDDESEDDFYWTDENNQRTKYAQKLSSNGIPNGLKSNGNQQFSSSSSSENFDNDELVCIDKLEDNPAVIDIEHGEKSSDLTFGCENENDFTKVNIRASPRSGVSSSRESESGSHKNLSATPGSLAVKL